MQNNVFWRIVKMKIKVFITYHTSKSLPVILLWLILNMFNFITIKGYSFGKINKKNELCLILKFTILREKTINHSIISL